MSAPVDVLAVLRRDAELHYALRNAPEANEETGEAIAAVAELIETLKMVDRIWSSDQTANLDPNSPKAKVRRALAYVGARHD